MFCFNKLMKKKAPVRTGDRSSRVKAAVFEATEALMAEHPRVLPSMAEIADRAEVMNSTSYWREPELAARQRRR